MRGPFLQSVFYSETGYVKPDYDAITQGAVTKAYGILSQARHDDIMGEPSCSKVSSGRCITGVYGYLGNPTTWFMWQLQGTTDGVRAFSDKTGEFVQPGSDWSSNRSNVGVAATSKESLAP